MHETYRMLGAEREAELLREAERLHSLPESQVRAEVSRRLSIARRTGRALVRFASSTLGRSRPGSGASGGRQTLSTTGSSSDSKEES